MATEENGAGATVCVTGASGFVGSWLVMRLLERGYRVKATVRDPGNVDKVKHILDLPNASTHLTLWKADLTEEASFDDAVQGCVGVFLVAAPLDFASVKDPENEFIKPSIDGVLNVMRSCYKAKTVRRIVYTSTTGTIEVQKQPLEAYDESVWTDVDFCRDSKMFSWMYFVAKTEAERAAWKFAKENNLDLVTIQPSTILGPYITPSKPSSSVMALALISKNKYFYSLIKQGHAVHVDDLCNAHIYLFEHSKAEGRYICSSHDFTIYDIARSLSKKYPEYNIPTEFEGIEKSLKVISCPSKKLTGIGFKFKFNSEEYDAGDLFAESIEVLKAKGDLL